MEFILPAISLHYFCLWNQKQKEWKRLLKQNQSLVQTKKCQIYFLSYGGRSCVSFDNIEAFGFDYNLLATIIQIICYLIDNLYQAMYDWYAQWLSLALWFIWYRETEEKSCNKRLLSVISLSGLIIISINILALNWIIIIFCPEHI